MDQDTLMAMAAAGILAVGIVGMIIIRKKKAAKAATQEFEKMGA
jgi:LPXTG-motif cell wall-anchored protein